MINPKMWQRSHYLFLLTGIWLSFLILLVILQVAHSVWGLRMPLYVEDRFWYWNLLRPSIAGISSTSSFWIADGRNPLSPVWYAIAGKFILSHPEYAFSILRHSVDLFSAISLFLLVDTLGRKSHRFFAFSCALLALFWNSVGLNVSWNIIAVTALHVISLWLYCLYLDSERHKGRLLALSILIYFFANATYLLVAFSFLVVGFFAIFRPSPRPKTAIAWMGRLFSAGFDMSLYGGALGLYLVLWQMMSSFPATNFLNLRLLSSQLPSSLYFTFIAPLSNSLPTFVGYHFQNRMWGISVLLFILSVVIFGLILWVAKWLNGSKTELTTDVSSSASLYSTIGYSLIVVLALAAYIVALESLTTAWPPGTRTFIIGQIAQPLTYISIFFALTHFFKRWLGKFGDWIQLIGVALICSLALFSSLSYQYVEIEGGSREQAFLDKLMLDIPSSSLESKPTEMLVLVTSENNSSDVMARMIESGGFLQNYYAQTTYRRGDLGLHILTKGQMAPDSQPNVTNNEYIFGADDKGIYMTTYLPVYQPTYTVHYTITWIPYQNIVFVKYDGKNWTLTNQFTAQELTDYKVRFERDTPAQSLYFASPSKPG